MGRFLMIAVAIVGCAGTRAPDSTTLPGSTTAPEVAKAFWCAPTGQCFTDDSTCKAHGDCARWDEAWCAVYSGDVKRFVCARDRSNCARFVDELRVEHGECVSRKAGK